MSMCGFPWAAWPSAAAVGPSKKPEPRPLSLNLEPVSNAIRFMLLPCLPSTLRTTEKSGSSFSHNRSSQDASLPSHLLKGGASSIPSKALVITSAKLRQTIFLFVLIHSSSSSSFSYVRVFFHCFCSVLSPSTYQSYRIVV